jgi:hypothetical protein
MAKGTIPNLSIAAGIDFGYFQRLGLTYPNLHEQLILSRTRLYFSIVKVSSNSKGQVNMNTRNKVRCHSILFPHNAAEVATQMFGSDLRGENGLLEINELRKLIHLYMVDPQGRPDAIARSIFQTVNLIGRPHVIAQWLIVLKWLHPHYSNIDVTDIKTTVQEVMDLVNKEVVDECETIDNPDAVQYEMGLGSDVAQVQNTEILNSNSGLGHDSTERCHASEEFNDISYSYVTNSKAACYGSARSNYRLAALDAFADYYAGDQHKDDSGDDCCDFNKDDIHDFLNKNPPSGKHLAARALYPRADFENDDVGLSTSFPQYFS